MKDKKKKHFAFNTKTKVPSCYHRSHHPHSGKSTFLKFQRIFPIYFNSRGKLVLASPETEENLLASATPVLEGWGGDT